MEDIADETREDEDEPFVAPPPEREQAPKMPAPYNWWTMPPVKRQILVDTLKDFVLRLSENYEIEDNVLRPCWFKHPGIVQEIADMWQWRSYQLYIEQQIPQAGMDFHIQLGPFLDRLQKRTRGLKCTGIEHVPWKAPEWLDVGDKAAAYDKELRTYWHQE